MGHRIQKREKQTEYEPYRAASPSPESPSPILSLEDFDVVVHGKNLLDWHGAIDYNRWHTTSLDDDHPYGYYPYLIVDGFVPGETYTIAADSIPDPGTAGITCVFSVYPGAYDPGSENYKICHEATSAWSHQITTFTASQSRYFLDCYGCNADNVTQVVRDWLPNMRIYQGSYTADTIPPTPRITTRLRMSHLRYGQLDATKIG